MVVFIIPAISIFLLELGLRLSGYGYCPEAIIKSKVNGKDVYCDNAKFGWRFFPKNISREFSPFTFDANKTDKTYRIFILGASAAQGEPSPPFGFGRILKVMLRETYPDVHFDVIVMAMAAINSHVVLEIAKDCAQYQPDMFVIYLGNNEVVGPYGAGTVFSSFSNNLFLIRAGIALKGMKLGQLMTNLLGPYLLPEFPPDVWRGMEMYAKRQVPIHDARLESVYKHFQRNLDDMIRLGRKAGAKVLLCTVGSNLKDNPPFGSLHSTDLSPSQLETWKAAYEEGVNHETAGDYRLAETSFRAAAVIDEDNADLHYRLGKCYWNLAEYEKAKSRYIQARDSDTLRFRADRRINQMIRDVANSDNTQGLYFVDAVKAFEENSPHEIPGSELFLEHVHLNFHGNYLLAKTIFEQIEKILPDRQGELKRAERPVLTEAACARHLAWTEWDQYKIADKIVNRFLKKAPFTNQLYHNEYIQEMDQHLAVLKASLTPEVLQDVASQYRQAIEQNSRDWMLRERYAMLLLEDLEDFGSALEQYRLMAQSVPHSYLGHYNVGTALFKLGDIDGGIEQLNKAIHIKPTYGYAHYLLALAYQKKNEIDPALKHYSEAIRWHPDLVPAYNNLAEVWMHRGELDKAIEICRRGLRFSTNSALLHCNLGVLLNKKNQRAEAIKEIRIALEIDPNSARIQNILKAVQRGDQ
ncbi:MAG: tetratricopeptide repeat protein [Sedimentisphaerales bacterium]|nr:tetratricopeptide repeat protein [Sedimentisphaerales bacterium]